MYLYLELMWFRTLQLLTSHRSLGPGFFHQHLFPECHWAWRCVSVLREHTASLPLHFYQHKTPGIWQVCSFRTEGYEEEAMSVFFICSMLAWGQHKETLLPCISHYLVSSECHTSSLQQQGSGKPLIQIPRCPRNSVKFRVGGSASQSQLWMNVLPKM
jgi:hypothetical protein